MATRKPWTRLQRRTIAENRARGCDALTFWHAPVEDCLQEIRRVHALRSAGEMGRRYYYALLTAGLLRLWMHLYEPNGPHTPNAKMAFPTSKVQAQAWVSGLITAARRDGRLPWEVILDTSRTSSSYGTTDLASDIATIGTSSFHLDPWLGQTERVEVWVEMEDAFALLDDICRPFLVPVNSVKGFSSADVIHKAAQRYRTGKNVVLYYYGDCEPSGLGIEESLYNELWAEGCRGFQATRLAITPGQAYQLPEVAAQELKPGDSRTKEYMRKYPGLKGFELDAYPTDELERALRATIRSHLDLDRWNEAVRLEREVRSVVTEQAKLVLGDIPAQWEHAIRHGHVLYDPLRNQPFRQETLDRYLGDEEEDDGDEEDEDD
jgi:hypothetical protein